MGSRILIADDEPNIVAALEYLLQRNGYEVSIARNGDEALKRIAEQLPDLVLLDVMMPLVSGYDVCRAVRQRDEWKHIKIILLTAKGRETDTQKGLGLGADLYITKPFSTRDLVARINGMLAAPA